MTGDKIVTVAQNNIGAREGKLSHQKIIDTYNGHKPLARNYKVKYTDEWCATFVSYCFIVMNATSLIGGTECSVQRFIDKFKKKGIWNEDGRIIPEPGDIICYNWDDGTQPNDGWADHIGIVEKVSKKSFVVIEGNMSNGAVGRRTVPMGWGYIRGFACPKYDEDRKSPQHTKYKYFKKCAKNENSLVDGLASVGAPTSFAARTKIALKNGIKVYTGSAKQNIILLDKLKKGALKK